MFVTFLLANIAVPLLQACKLLERPPILSYNGYALYKRSHSNKKPKVKTWPCSFCLRLGNYFMLFFMLCRLEAFVLKVILVNLD